MPIGNWDIEYLGANAVRSFPLADDATKSDVTGAFTIVDSFLVELYLSLPWSLAVDPSNFYLASLAVFPIGYAVSIGYDDGTGSPPTVATATFAAATHTENRAYALSGTGDFSAITGKVVVGTLDDINLQPAGLWTFAYAGGKLDPDTVRPIIKGLSALTVTSGGVTSAPLYGDVELVAGTNVRLTITGQSIRIDAIDGAGLTAGCSCTGGTTPPPPILTINGIGPDPSGAFTIVGNACMDVAASGTGLTLSDLCSQPCCGCPELEALTAEIGHVDDEATTVAAYLAGLQAQVDAMSANVLGSRLGDAPCLPPCA